MKKAFLPALLVVIMLCLGAWLFAQDGTVTDPFIFYHTANLRLTWNAYPVEEDIQWIGFQLYPVSGQPSGSIISEDLALTEPTQSSYNLVSLITPIPNGTYYFRIRAIRANHEASDWTQEFVVVKAWTVNPSAPSNIYVRP